MRTAKATGTRKYYVARTRRRGVELVAEKVNKEIYG